jgi:hypothetical protein
LLSNHGKILKGVKGQYLGDAACKLGAPVVESDPEVVFPSAAYILRLVARSCVFRMIVSNDIVVGASFKTLCGATFVAADERRLKGGRPEAFLLKSHTKFEAFFTSA